MISIPLDEKVDWFRIIITLERSGYSHLAISRGVGVSKGTVCTWKTWGRVKFEDGQKLLKLWVRATNGQETVPTVPLHSRLS